MHPSSVSPTGKVPIRDAKEKETDLKQKAGTGRGKQHERVSCSTKSAISVDDAGGSGMTSHSPVEQIKSHQH